MSLLDEGFGLRSKLNIRMRITIRMNSKSHFFIDVCQEARMPDSIGMRVSQNPMWPAETHECHTECFRDLHDYRNLYAVLDQTPSELLDQCTPVRLQTLVSSAYNHIPFYNKIYRRAGFEPGDLKSLGDLSLLTSVSKKDLQTVYLR